MRSPWPALRLFDRHQSVTSRRRDPLDIGPRPCRRPRQTRSARSTSGDASRQRPAGDRSTNWLRSCRMPVVRGHIGEQLHNRSTQHLIGEGIAHRVRRRLHQRTVERRRHRQLHRALRTHLLGQANGPFDCSGMARQHDLAWVVVVGDFANFALGRGGRDLPGQLDVRPRSAATRRLRPVPRLHLPARIFSSLAVSPAGTNRPRTAPIFAEALAGESSRHRAANAHGADRRGMRLIAGCAFSVSLSSSSGPSRISRNRLCPSASSTSSNTSRAERLAPASAAPMPTAWLPCPGNSNARIFAPVQL